MEEGPFKQAAPYNVPLPGFPFQGLRSIKYCHIALQPVGDELDGKGEYIGDVGFFPETSDGKYRYQRSQNEQKLAYHLLSCQPFAFEIVGNLNAGNQLYLFAALQGLKHFWLIIVFSPCGSLNFFKQFTDSCDFVFVLGRLTAGGGCYFRIFFQEDVRRVMRIAIFAMIVHHFKDEFYHLGTDEKLLENCRLLSVLGEEEELSQKLQSSEVLQVAVAMQRLAQSQCVHITQQCHRLIIYYARLINMTLLIHTNSSWTQLQISDKLLQSHMQTEENLAAYNICQARNLFKTHFSPQLISPQQTAHLLTAKINGQYSHATKHFQEALQKQTTDKPEAESKQATSMITEILKTAEEKKEVNHIPTLLQFEQNVSTATQNTTETSLVLSKKLQMNLAQSTRLGTIRATSLRKLIRPKWHRPFKLYRVIVGHHGWVRCLAISPCNTYFASGSADRTIKFWDLASGQLKISLTGHINTLRALQFSKQHPYLFSCGEDKSIKCWDLEMNKVIRNYHGHLSGVYCMKIHQALGVLVSGGRDSTARVWDVRVRKQVHALVGHSHTVGSILTQQSQPNVITGSYDSFIKTWDIGQGRCVNTLTNHKKSVRALVQHPTEYTFASAASDNIKVWKCPNGEFLRNISGHHSIIDAMTINQDNVLVSGGDDGTLKFWDWQSGYNFQDTMSQPQPGSIAAQNGIFALTFDRSGCRLLSGECDKTIKMWKQDETATEQTHPIKQFKMEFDRS